MAYLWQCWRSIQRYYIISPLWGDAHLNHILKAGLYLQENTSHLHPKDQSVNYVLEIMNLLRVEWTLQINSAGKMSCCLILKQAVHKVTAFIQRVKFVNLYANLRTVTVASESKILDQSPLLSVMSKILSLVWVTIDGVRTGNWIYSTLRERNYK
jgi:hypothetical protein